MHISCVLSVVYHDLVRIKNVKILIMNVWNLLSKFLKNEIKLFNDLFILEHYEKEMMFNHVYEQFLF